MNYSIAITREQLKDSASDIGEGINIYGYEMKRTRILNLLASYVTNGKQKWSALSSNWEDNTKKVFVMGDINDFVKNNKVNDWFGYTVSDHLLRPYEFNVYLETAGKDSFIIHKIFPNEKKTGCSNFHDPIKALELMPSLNILIKNLPEKGLLELIEKNGSAIFSVKKPSQKAWELAVSNSPELLEYSPYRTKSMSLGAILSDPSTIKFSDYIDEETIIAYYSHPRPNPYYRDSILRFVSHEKIRSLDSRKAYAQILINEIPTETLGYEGVLVIPLEYWDAEMIMDTVPFNGGLLAYVPTELKTDSLELQAVKNHPNAIIYVRQQTEELCLEALNPSLHVNMEFIEVQTEPVIKLMIERAHQGSLSFLKDKSIENRLLNMAFGNGFFFTDDEKKDKSVLDDIAGLISGNKLFEYKFIDTVYSGENESNIHSYLVRVNKRKNLEAPQDYFNELEDLLISLADENGEYMRRDIFYCWDAPVTIKGKCYHIFRFKETLPCDKKVLLPKDSLDSLFKTIQNSDIFSKELVKRQKTEYGIKLSEYRGFFVVPSFSRWLIEPQAPAVRDDSELERYNYSTQAYACYKIDQYLSNDYDNIMDELRTIALSVVEA